MDEATHEQAEQQFSQQREFARRLLEAAAPAFSAQPRVTGEG
jgi:hypothetical protein